MSFGARGVRNVSKEEAKAGVYHFGIKSVNSETNDTGEYMCIAKGNNVKHLPNTSPGRNPCIGKLMTLFIGLPIHNNFLKRVVALGER